jgi:hypothetical protein
MKGINVVLGFFLLMGLLIFRMIEERRDEVRRPESKAREPHTLSKKSHPRRTQRPQHRLLLPHPRNSPKNHLKGVSLGTSFC